MVIDLSEFINSNDIVFASNGVIDRLRRDMGNELRLRFPISYNLEIYKVDDELEMILKTEYKYDTECARCLKEITPTHTACLEIELIQNDESSDISEDYIRLYNNSLDLDECMYSLILTSRPLRDLCATDCKGICPTCGRDLNDGECDCSSEEIDPRMAILLDIFNED